MCNCEHNELNENEQEAPNPTDTFPSFRSFYDTDGPFQISYPFAKLQPEKFVINDSPRNFPKEAQKRPLLYGEEEDLTDVVLRSKRHINIPRG